jgi:hypothetical protein
MNQRFFLLMSRITSAPEVIKAGQYVRFLSAGQALHPDLLPLALNAIISERPLSNSGDDTLKAGL